MLSVADVKLSHPSGIPSPSCDAGVLTPLRSLSITAIVASDCTFFFHTVFGTTVCLLPESSVCSFCVCLWRRVGFLLTTQVLGTLIALAFAACCSRLVGVPAIIPPVK